MSRSTVNLRSRFLAAVLAAALLPLQPAFALRATQEGTGLEELQSKFGKKIVPDTAILMLALGLGVVVQAPEIQVVQSADQLASARSEISTVVSAHSPAFSARILTRTLRMRIEDPAYKGPAGRQLVSQLLRIPSDTTREGERALAHYLSDSQTPAKSRLEVIGHLTQELKTARYPEIEKSLQVVMLGNDSLRIRQAAYRALYSHGRNQDHLFAQVSQEPGLRNALLARQDNLPSSFALAVYAAADADPNVRRLAAGQLKRAWKLGQTIPGLFSATLRLAHDSAIDSRPRYFLLRMSQVYGRAVLAHPALYAYPNLRRPKGYAVMAGRIPLGMIWYEKSRRQVFFRSFGSSARTVAVDRADLEQMSEQMTSAFASYQAVGVDLPPDVCQRWVAFVQHVALRMTEDVERGRSPMSQKSVGLFSYQDAVPGTHVTSPFGAPRPEGRHTGVDLAAAIGTPLYAIGDGVVVKTASDSISGLHVIIEYDLGPLSGVIVQVSYGHCSQLLVKEGQRVRRGEVVAFSGDTGNARGKPHVHFQVLVDGVPVDPGIYARRYLSRLPKFNRRSILSPPAYGLKLQEYLVQSAGYLETSA